MANNLTFTLNIKALFDAEDVKNKLSNIQTTLSNLKVPDKMGRDITNSFINANKALDDFILKSQRGVKTSGDATGISRSFENVTKELNKLDKLLDGVRAEVADGVDLSHFFKIDEKTKTRLAELTQEIDDLKTRISNINTSKLDELNNILSSIKKGKKAKEHGAEAIELFKEGEVDEAIASLDKLIEKYKKLEERNKNTNAGDTYGQNVIVLTQLKDVMVNAREEAVNLNNEMGEKTAEAALLTNLEIKRLTGGINEAADGVREYGQKANEAASDINGLAGRTADFNKELDLVKSRIAYFFSLNNAIGLVKRSLRDAFLTVKELDKAMTETAVVTNFTVGDMWDLLPEYTKRANELGVSTKAAYEAATIYYQQGLKTNEVVAMSNETLKMARIAGLDAAVATDRMTNAIRGFNMEINEANALRIDDVYSRLAAISASNVDEISTAMTKVASLANSANMEFETTSAFLAQMIETTRESAETAGTALKTVVARFSEVKKLVNEDQLKGQDEEGQLIDVNKVSAALRTAGIDLNRYFLGEVGLDDIFMELASKWDSLTVLQLRYIATLAAGSRQQSRFIAMMSDYARTLELVGEAYNANGAAAKQFAKTLESLESKLARLTNAWHEFTMGLSNNEIIKFGVDRLTDLLNLVNKLTSGFGKFSSGMPGVLGSLTKFISLMAMLRGGSAIFKNILPTALGKLGKTTLGAGLFKTLGITANVEAKEAGGEFKSIVVLAANLFKGIVTGTGIKNEVNKKGLGLLAATKKFKQDNASPMAESLDKRIEEARTAYANSTRLDENYNLIWDENLAVTNKAKLLELLRLRKNMVPTTLFGALGNKFIGTKIGGKMLAGLASVFGESSIFAGAAAGAATLATALAGIAAVLATIYGLYKLWERFSYAGQIKTANKWAESLLKVADTNKKFVESTLEIADKYKELTKAIDESSNALNRNKAIANRNTYLTELSSSNPEYSKYITSNRINGQLVYTFDEEAYNREVVQKALLASKNSMLNAQVGNIMITALEAKKERDELGTWKQGQNMANESLYHNFKTGQDITPEEYEELMRNLTSKELEVSSSMANVFNQLLPENLKDSVANNLASVLGSSFDSYNYFLGIQNTSISKEEARKEYEEKFGIIPNDMTDEQVVTFIRYLKAIEGLSGSIEAAESLIKKENGEEIVAALNGSYSGSYLDLISNIKNSYDDYSELLKAAFGIETFELFEELIKQGFEVLKKTYIKTARVLSKNTKINNNEAKKILETFTVDQLKYINNLSDSFASYNSNFNDIILSQVTSSIESGEYESSELKKLIDNLSSDPLLTFSVLNKAIHGTNTELSKFASNLIEVEKNGRFSNENLLSNYLMSDSFEDVNKELEKFIEENGKITGANIKEVAENYDTLNTLLKENVISATGLARILNSGISPASISNSLIAAANTLDDIDSQMESIINKFNDFDAGYNEHDIANFFNSAYDTINDAVERNAYGNNQIASFYNEIFSLGLTEGLEDLSNEEYAEEIKKRTEFAKQFFEDNKANLNNAAYEVFGNWSADGVLALMFKVEDGSIIYDTLGKTSDEIIDIIEENGKINGKKISRSMAEALFGYLKEQSPEFSRILSLVDIQKGLSEWYNELKTDINGGKYFTQSDIDAFALLYGISAEEAETQIKETYGILATKVKADNAYDLLKEIGYEDTLKASTYIVKENDKEESFDALDFNKLYNVLAPLGKLDELDNVAKKIIEETGIKKAVANIDGELREFDINTGQSLTEAYEAAIEKTPIEVNGLGEISAAIQDILSVLDPSGKHRDNTETYTLEQNRSKVNLVLDQNSETEFANALKRRAYEILGNVSRTLDLTNEKIKEIREDIDNNNIVAAYEKIKTSIVDKTESAEEALLEELILFNPKVDTSTLETAIQNATTITTSIVAAATEEAALSMWRKQARALAILQVKKENGWDKLADKEFNKYLDADLEEHILKLSEQNYRDISSVVEAAGGFNYLKDAFTPKTPTKIPTTGSTTPAIDNTEDKDKGGSDKGTEWKNEFDWLYNLMEDLAELQRLQNLLLQQEQDLIRSDNATGHDLYRNLISQYANLSSQLEHLQTILDKRSLEMEELVRDNIEYSKYAWWEDNTVNIDWDKIEAIEDQETYDAVKAFVDEMETVLSKMDEAESSLLDIEAEMYELERKYRDAYIEFENRVKEALIQLYQDTIDLLSSLNETITESNNNILNSIKELLGLERLIRDNTQTEKDIADKQAKLAYLQRDTTGGSQAEILKLLQEIEDAQQNYTDTLIDLSILKLLNDNEKAAEQRQLLITLMQELLDWNKEQGTFNQEVHDIIERSTNSKGELINGSELEELLKAKDNWTAMTEAERAVWSEKLDDEHDYWNAYYEFLNGDSDGTFWKAVESLKEAINGINMGRTNSGKKHGNSSDSSNDDDDSIFEANDGSKWRWTSDGLRPKGRFGLRQNEDNPEQYDVVLDNFKDTDILVNKKGGLNTTTGLAWLDGTPSEPEYVLNARQTAAFLKLADVLPSFMESGINPTSITGGNVYVELNMNVDQISSDYDVDRIVDRVKADIESAASYRNISSISLLR